MYTTQHGKGTRPNGVLCGDVVNTGSRETDLFLKHLSNNKHVEVDTNNVNEIIQIFCVCGLFNAAVNSLGHIASMISK
jgi:hypothetical protein